MTCSSKTLPVVIIELLGPLIRTIGNVFLYPALVLEKTVVPIIKSSPQAVFVALVAVDEFITLLTELRAIYEHHPLAAFSFRRSDQCRDLRLSRLGKFAECHGEFCHEIGFSRINAVVWQHDREVIGVFSTEILV